MRRATASAPTAASSTTKASATARPARAIALNECPSRSRTSAAAIRASGIVTRAMSRERHANRNAARTSASSPAAMITARVRLSIAVSMKPAGRKTDVSVRMPARPGRSSSSALSTPRVTSAVFAPGNFSTTSIRPSRSLTTASPMSG
jgi:hypothetical protein